MKKPDHFSVKFDLLHMVSFIYEKYDTFQDHTYSNVLQKSDRIFLGSPYCSSSCLRITDQTYCMPPCT